MSRVLVTGAQGFIGQALVHRLLSAGLLGQPIKELILLDLAAANSSGDARVRVVRGSLADDAVRRMAINTAPDVIFHLASVPGGAAERDPALGRSVNLDATLGLVEACRALPTPPRFIYASSVAVYGENLGAVLHEDSPPAPATTYGAHKLMCEIALADASRRGWVQGASLRLPGVVARPDENTGLVSAFMSQLFCSMARGQAITLPISPQGRCWWISVGACVDNLLQMATINPAQWSAERRYQMPVLHLSIQAVAEELLQRFGGSAEQLLHYAPQPAVERLFASAPPLLTPQAERLGLRSDGDVHTLVTRAQEGLSGS
ncbi:NAD-dependent epimerase/dehydratase family protein [Variovorax sp. HJSM1_2]|uniref:NAD-dependent epimerase/dehydratase family protein n=1 Tax=Variovorax sp. HJSM1_2 TaxID=3366263 RepID=UPI003BCA9153